MGVNTRAAARELGAGLRRLRGDRSIRDVAAVLAAAAGASGFSVANLSHWERGERTPNEERLNVLLTALDTPDVERERLHGLRRQADGPGELASGPATIGAAMARYIEHEQAASRVTEVALGLVPGILQTADYARAIFGAGADASAKVSLRLGRRDILTRSRQPAELLALIDSEALVRPIVPPDVMADQLHHLLKMAKLPNVCVRLVESTAPGYSPHLVGSFVLLEFATADPLVHVEHYRASASIWEPSDVRHFQAAVVEIEKRALTAEESSEAIAAIVNGMETM